MKHWIAIGLVCLGTSLLGVVVAGPEPGSATAALDVLAGSGRLEPSERVLGMVGFFGQPRPSRWLVLTDAAGEGGPLRELAVSGENVSAERKVAALPGQDLPDIPLERPDLKVDSDEVYRIAGDLARERGVRFEGMHFQLRCRELAREPVWMLNLVGSGQVSVGVVYVSAITGDVLRTAWVDMPVTKLGSPLSAADPSR